MVEPQQASCLETKQQLIQTYMDTLWCNVFVFLDFVLLRLSLRLAPILRGVDFNVTDTLKALVWCFWRCFKYIYIIKSRLGVPNWLSKKERWHWALFINAFVVFFPIKMQSNPTRTQAAACEAAVELNRCLSCLAHSYQHDKIHKGGGYCRAVVFDCIRLEPYFLCDVYFNYSPFI